MNKDGRVGIECLDLRATDSRCSLRRTGREMEKVTAFFQMGGYAAFVWSSLGLTVAVMAGLLIATLRQLQARSEEHTSELQSLMRISYAVFCLKKKNDNRQHRRTPQYNKHN